MANTSSARKAARKIARRTEVNKARRSRMRSALRKVEEAIASGDRNKALEAMKNAEPALMRAARQGQVHREHREPQGVAADAPDRQARQIAARSHAGPACRLFTPTLMESSSRSGRLRARDPACRCVAILPQSRCETRLYVFLLIPSLLDFGRFAPLFGGGGYPVFSVTEMSCGQRVYRQYPSEEFELPQS